MDDPEDGSAIDPEAARSAPYTIHDDLSILKVVSLYYGCGFHGKMPWSFWQTYKRVTNSPRSNSSLYHHWNGSIRKKYENFLSAGRIMDCILCLETAIMTQQAIPQSPHPPAGHQLYHHFSQPPVPLTPHAPPRDRSLVRTVSNLPQACDPLQPVARLLNH
jgi:hypothetical protein